MLNLDPEHVAKVIAERGPPSEGEIRKKEMFQMYRWWKRKVKQMIQRVHFFQEDCTGERLPSEFWTHLSECYYWIEATWYHAGLKIDYTPLMYLIGIFTFLNVLRESIYEYNNILGIGFNLLI